MYTQNKKYLISTIVLLILPLSGVSIDIYVPSLPAVCHYFTVTESLAQLTVTTYMIGLGFMQLFAGSISDSFGRKKPFIIAMTVFILATLFIPHAKNIHQLLLLRFIQGCMLALTVVPMRSVIMDLFEGREFIKMTNYMVMAWSIGPIIAPAIGGYLQYYFGWKSCFYFLTIYSIITLILALIILPETSAYRHPFNVSEILKRYRQILLHWQFSSGLLIDALLYSFIILFGIVTPFLIQNVLHYSSIQFGHITLLMGLAWFMGTMTNRFLIDIPIAIKVKTCCYIILITTLCMLAAAFIFPLNIYNVTIPTFISLWTGGVVFPNYFARSVSYFPKISGSANAAFGSFIFIISGVSSIVGTSLKSTSDIPLACAYVGLTVLCLLVYYLAVEKK
jgi:Bcr/CflA subfamily drug resistance transporter